MLNNILRDVNLAVDGRGYAGQIEALELPKLKLKTEDVRAGGMDAPVAVQMGMEPLEWSFSLITLDPNVLRLWGLGPGQYANFTARGALQDEVTGATRAAVGTFQGQIVEFDPGSWKPGDKATSKFTVKLVYYRLQVGGDTVHEIDVLNYKRVVGGVDQLQELRAALGL